jgi:deazaflavin-dependent oxidoreductase (nitroreductase family)
MAFEIPPNGSRGARMPSGATARFGATVTAGLYRLSGGRVGVGHGLLLTTIGAKSGERRVASLRRFEDGDGRWLVVASAGGQAKQPSWLVNLSRNPDSAWAEVGRDRFKVGPEILDADERATAWRRIVAEAPQFGGYETKTDREIPVVRLTRLEPG